MKKKPINKSTPTFEVRFVGPGVDPSRVPVRMVSDALSAVQNIASGRDPYETAHVTEDQSIGLIDVRKGSAVYSCVAHTPKLAIQNLKRAGTVIAAEEVADEDAEYLASMLKPIQSLSDISRSMGCIIEVHALKSRKRTMITVGEGDYRRISERVLLRGKTNIVGRVVRVGGATGTKCALRLPTTHRLLFCEVKNRDLARRLGQQLYQNIMAHGEATWVHRSWHIYRFTIESFTQPEIGDPREALAELKQAGMSAWDSISDPAAYIRELR